LEILAFLQNYYKNILKKIKRLDSKRILSHEVMRIYLNRDLLGVSQAMDQKSFNLNEVIGNPQVSTQKFRVLPTLFIPQFPRNVSGVNRSQIRVQKPSRINCAA
jgi:hypothetical protein